ncbi:MAG TPA: 50S ribosomal protein L9 [Candidatus Acetothermia bacterium]|nr:50S ribosomal protein L9 [Candidatus Acetothermia bacterium]HEX32184.1 50S ribosomal protein L9 [Candidatus Acetothermia bacterium]
MKIIIRQEVEKLGSPGDIVEVRDGYARNYLIPRGLAMPATKGNLRILEEERRRAELRANREKRAAERLAEKLNSVSITATVSVGEEDRVFGAVTTQTIADLLKEKGFDIDRRRIMLDEPLKALGIYDVPIKLHPEVEAKVKVWVVRE